MQWLDIVALIAAGLTGGFLAGLLGVGGGTVYIVVLPPILRWWGVQSEDMPSFIIANSLFAIIIASVSATITNIKTGNFPWQPVVKMMWACGLAATIVLMTVVHSGKFSMWWYDMVTLVMFAYMLWVMWKSRKQSYEGDIPVVAWWRWALAGTVSGAVSALSGLGGGVVTVPIVNGMFKVDVKKATAISLGVIVPTSIILGVNNVLSTPVHPVNAWSHGFIIWPVAIALSAGVIVASPFGVLAAKKMNSKTISTIYAIFIVLVILNKCIDILKG